MDNYFVKVFQDKLGFIWGVNINGKLFRYNGVEFEKIQVRYGYHDDILANLNQNSTTTMDNEGAIWFALGSGGILRFNPSNYSTDYYHDFIPSETDNSNSLISGVMCDRDGQIWATTFKSLFRFRPTLGTFEQVYFDEKATYIRPWCDGGKEYFVFHVKYGTYSQYKKIHKATEEVSLMPPVAPATGYRVSGGRGDYVWEINSSKGIVKRNLSTDKYQTWFTWDNPYLLGYQFLSEIWETPDGGIWALEDGVGLHYFPIEKDTIVFYPYDKEDPFALPGHIVYGIILGKDGNYWAATSGGLCMLPTQKNPFSYFSFENLLEGVKERDVVDSQPITLINDDGLLIGMDNGIYLFDKRGKRIIKSSLKYPALAPLDASNINNFFTDQRGNIWINEYSTSSWPAVWYRYQPEQDRLQPLHEFAGFDNLPKSAIRESYMFFEDKQENIYFVDYRFPQLVKLEATTDSITYFDYGGRHELGYMGVFDKEKRLLWVATNFMGVFRYDWNDQSYKQFYFDPNDPLKTANLNNGYLFQRKNGDILVTISHSIFEYDETTSSFKQTTSGLPGDILDKIEDEKGNLWIIMDKGRLAKLDSNLNLAATYSVFDGLKAENWQGGSIISDQNGWIYLSDNSSLTVFHPDSIPINNNIPPVYITHLELFNHPVWPGGPDSILSKPIHITKSIRLRYSQNVITLKYAALNYLDAEENEYAYKLEGFDEDWQYVGNRREVTYTNLSPGTYTFRVKGSNNDGIWNEEGATLEIMVIPPWYRSTLAYSLYVLALIALFYGFYRFQLNRQLEKQEAVRLRELDDFKSQLYTNITHEFRTPLTVILGMAERALQLFDLRDSNSFKQSIKLVKRNGQQLLGLVNQMLSLASLDAGKLIPKWQQGPIVPYLSYLAESFHSLADDKNITIRQAHEQPGLVMDFDAEKLDKITSNLLSNAIKFTPIGGMVELSSRQVGEQFIIQVKDNGIGIPETEQALIFDRFFKSGNSNSQAEGTGIGLALAKELAKLMEGDIEVESQPGQGTTFTVLLHIHRKAPLAGAPTEIEKIAFMAKGDQDKDLTGGKKGALAVLIVEDNKEVAYYLASCLESQYRLLYAQDGQEGIERAIKDVPDFIISDVMMPQKDGFELCRTLKTDERTSHIPIVLLTAKADEASRMDGLQQGADAYLTKPFNADELQVRIEQMIALRKRLKAKYQKAPSDWNNTVKMDDSLEDAFLQKLRDVVEAHLTDPELDVSVLCKKMGMSRTQVHRKLGALADMSTTQFIRAIRYQKAKELLVGTDLAVSEIAYDVGFSDPAYFTRMFRKEVGLTPREYKQQNSP